jgi:hypothetical protein
VNVELTLFNVHVKLKEHMLSIGSHLSLDTLPRIRWKPLWYSAPCNTCGNRYYAIYLGSLYLSIIYKDCSKFNSIFAVRQSQR